MLGGTSGALQTDFPTCVTQVYGQKKASMVIEGDFVAADAERARAYDPARLVTQWCAVLIEVAGLGAPPARGGP